LIGSFTSKVITVAVSVELSIAILAGRSLFGVTRLQTEIGRSGEGDALVDFIVTDLGQVQFSTQAVSGIDHTGIISYRAISILNT